MGIEMTITGEDRQFIRHIKQALWSIGIAPMDSFSGESGIILRFRTSEVPEEISPCIVCGCHTERLSKAIVNGTMKQVFLCEKCEEKIESGIDVKFRAPSLLNITSFKIEGLSLLVDEDMLRIKQDLSNGEEEIMIPLNGNGWFRFRDFEGKKYMVRSDGTVEGGE